MGSQKRCLRAPIQIKDLDNFFENTACFLSQKRCPQPRKFSKKLSFGMSRLCLDASAGSLPAGSGRASQSASTIQVGVLADDGLALQFKRRGHRETENVLRVERIAPNVQLSPLSEKVRARRSSFAVFREIGRVLTFGLEAPEPGRTRDRGSAAPCLVPVGQCKASAHVEVRQLMPGSSYSTCISR